MFFFTRSCGHFDAKGLTPVEFYECQAFFYECQAFFYECPGEFLGCVAFIYQRPGEFFGCVAFIYQRPGEFLGCVAFFYGHLVDEDGTGAFDSVGHDPSVDDREVDRHGHVHARHRRIIDGQRGAIHAGVPASQMTAPPCGPVNWIG